MTGGCVVFLLFFHSRGELFVTGWFVRDDSTVEILEAVAKWEQVRVNHSCFQIRVA